MYKIKTLFVGFVVLNAPDKETEVLLLLGILKYHRWRCVYTTLLTQNKIFGKDARILNFWYDVTVIQ